MKEGSLDELFVDNFAGGGGTSTGNMKDKE